jgi:hypothetical protein
MPENKPKSNPSTEPSGDQGKDPVDLSRLTSGSSHSMTNSQPRASNTVRCNHVGETNGATEDETVHRAEEHWRKEHGTGDWTEAIRSKAREATKHRQAA